MNKSTSFAFLTLGAFIALSGTVFAQEDSAVVPSSMAPKNVRPLMQDVRAKQAEIKSSIQDTREAFRETSVDLRQNVKAQMVSATSSEERRAIEKKAILDRKEIIGERQASTTALREQQKTLARQHLKLIGERYRVAIKQFENLATRIQSRIDKMKTVGADTSSAESALATALSIIAQLKTDAQAIVGSLSQVETGTGAKAARSQVEASVKKINAEIKSARDALESSVKALMKVPRTQNAEGS